MANYNRNTGLSNDLDDLSQTTFEQGRHRPLRTRRSSADGPSVHMDDGRKFRDLPSMSRTELDGDP